MKTRTTDLSIVRAARLGLLGLSAALLSAGCGSSASVSGGAGDGSLRAIQTPPNASEADVDRAMLARFIGEWTFRGRIGAPGDVQREVAGIAAAVIESEHFVLIDLMATSGEMAGRNVRKSGSILLGSEPGVGLTMTAWGDASPSMSRLLGWVDNGGASFEFRELRTPPGKPRVALSITVENDDRWVAEIQELGRSARPVIARYEFERID